MKDYLDVRHIIPKWYYYMTPLFFALDYFAGLSVRVTFFDTMPHYKYLYYGFCVLCGIGMFVVPRCTPFVALCESIINIAFIVLHLFQPYITFLKESDNVLDFNWDSALPFTPPQITNLLLAGGIAVLAFHGSIQEISMAMGLSDRRPANQRIRTQIDNVTPPENSFPPRPRPRNRRIH